MAERSGDMSVGTLHTFVMIGFVFIIVIITVQAVIWGSTLNDHLDRIEQRLPPTTTTSVGK